MRVSATATATAAKAAEHISINTLNYTVVCECVWCALRMWMGGCGGCLRGNSSLLINEFTNLIIETCNTNYVGCGALPWLCLKIPYACVGQVERELTLTSLLVYCLENCNAP